MVDGRSPPTSSRTWARAPWGSSRPATPHPWPPPGTDRTSAELPGQRQTRPLRPLGAQRRVSQRSAWARRVSSCSTVASDTLPTPDNRLSSPFTWAWVSPDIRTMSRARSAFSARSWALCSRRRQRLGGQRRPTTGSGRRHQVDHQRVVEIVGLVGLLGGAGVVVVGQPLGLMRAAERDRRDHREERELLLLHRRPPPRRGHRARRSRGRRRPGGAGCGGAGRRSGPRRCAGVDRRG